MTDLNPDSTQAVAARKLLNRIATKPENFNMNWWLHGTGPASFQGSIILGPDEEPSCGTVMCAAGWAAHDGGWEIWKTFGSGTWAYKNRGTAEEVKMAVAAAGARALDIKYRNIHEGDQWEIDEAPDLFWVGEDKAVAILTRMAAGEAYRDEMCSEYPDLDNESEAEL